MAIRRLAHPLEIKGQALRALADKGRDNATDTWNVTGQLLDIGDRKEAVRTLAESVTTRVRAEVNHFKGDALVVTGKLANTAEGIVEAIEGNL
ncbi:MAG TPA: hypothetical protein VEW42_00775 [Candidatus Eisenbacteria bacterium]|nr:hypothetical protein [Candidatus Eisenbacteria bacterium]